MFYVDILGKDCFFSFRPGAVMFVIRVLGWSGRWWCFGGMSKMDNGLFGFVRNLTDLGLIYLFFFDHAPYVLNLRGTFTTCQS